MSMGTLTDWWSNAFPPKLKRKPWMIPNIRNNRRERSTAFKSGDSNFGKKAKYDLRKAIKTAKRITNWNHSTGAQTPDACGKDCGPLQTTRGAQGESPTPTPPYQMS